MFRTFALCCALAAPLVAGGCSTMGGLGSASDVSPDSQGKGAISGAVAPQGTSTVGTPGNKN